MEFDSQGRIILPGSIAADQEKDSSSIIIEKVQVSTKNPAVAQLKISVGQDLRKKLNEDFLIKEIYNFCKNFIDRSYRFNDVQSSINMIGTSTIIIETRSSLKMYSLLDEIVVEMRELYVNNKSMKISLKGGYGR